MNFLKNKKGQGLIEYLVLVCLIAVGSMAVVRVLGKNVRVQFANVSRSLGGGDAQALDTEDVKDSDYSKRDFSDFMTGAGNGNSGNKGGGSARGGRGTNRSGGSNRSNLFDVNRTMPGEVGN